MDEAELKKVRFYALKITNLRPRSIEELGERLRARGFAAEIIEQVISEFARKGLLNDSKFSRLWIEGRMASNPKGERVLREELKARGITDEVIEEALGRVKKDYDEYEVVKNLADKRMVFLSGLDRKTAKRRLFGYLRRRGFSTEIIMKVIREIGIDKD